jgi:DnaJ-class molecular chaperone
MSADDFYELLGVPQGADADAIKSAFRSKARKLHPDVSDDPDAGKKFSALNEAYEVLSDPEKRARYDRFGHDRFVSGMSDQHVRAQDMDFGDLGSIIDAMFGGRGGQSGFGGFGGGRPGGQHRAAPRGQSLQLGIRVSLMDVHQGATKTISVPSGDGFRSIDVKVPMGVKDGAKLRLAGQGMPSPMPGGQPGDVLVRINVERGGRFERINPEGSDLQTEVPLSIAEATLGAKIDVRTIDDRVVTMTIPAGTASGARFRVGRQGLSTKGGSRGDLFVCVRIVPPSGAEISEALREALEELPALERS